MASILKSLRVLADSTRLRLLLLLQQEELSVAEMCGILGMGQSRISSHLAQLRSAGLVAVRRAGKNIYYAISAEGLSQELGLVLQASAGEVTEVRSDNFALGVVRQKRADLSREYFNRMAGKFGKTYCPGRSWKGLTYLFLELLPPLEIADLGAGEGHLSQLLARRAKRVIAVDMSEKMVEYGANLAREKGILNLEYRLGRMEEPPIDAQSVDLVLLSQALHHAAEPLRVLRAARGILREGGKLVILDLLAHRFEKARELYADVWLGFTEAQLLGLLEEAGFGGTSAEVVSRDEQNPAFQTVFATGIKQSAHLAARP